MWSATLVLILSVLIFLRTTAKLAAMNPSMLDSPEQSHSQFFERVTTKRTYMILGTLSLAGLMSGLLYVLTLIAAFQSSQFTVIDGLMISGFVVMLTVFVVLFSKKWLHRLVVALCVLGTVIAWLLWPNWLTTDAVAAVLALSMLCFFLRIMCNFKIVAMYVGGLFVYDVVNVFWTGNMMKLAESVLNKSRPLPLLIIVPQNVGLDAPRVEALGLGDIVAPGLLVLIASVLAYRHHKMFILNMALVGYAVGLALAFVALTTMNMAQPALLYLYPCIMASILFAAWRTGLLRELLALKQYNPGTSH